MTNEFDYDAAVTASLTQTAAAEARIGFSAAADTNPDAHAEDLRIARRTGLPVPTVTNLPQEARRQDAMGRIDFATLAEQSPSTAALLADPEKAKLAHDDTENMGALESSIRTLRGPEASFGSVVSGLAKSLPQGAEMARQGLRMQFADLLGFDGMGQDAQRKYSLASLESALSTPQFDSATARGVYGGLSSTVRMAPGLAASIATRSTAPMLATMGLQTQTEAYGKYAARGATGIEAFLAATGEGVVEVVTEIPAMGFLVSQFGKIGAGKFLAGLLAREIPTEQAATLAQDAIDTAIANPDKTWGQYAAERPGAAYETLVATVTQAGIMSAVSGVSARMQRKDQAAKQSEQTTLGIEQINKLAEASKLRERDPATFAQFIEQATKDGPVQHVFIDAQSLAQSGVVEQVAALSPAVAEQYQFALETGGQVRIPVAEYASTIAGSEFAQPLLDHLKTEPNGFSRVEAQEYMQTQAEQMQAEVERVMAEKQDDDTFKASRDIVRDAVKLQLDAANRFKPDVNATYSTMVSNFYAVTAAKMNITPEALFERYPLAVNAEGIGTLNQSPVTVEEADEGAYLAAKSTAGSVSGTVRDGALHINFAEVEAAQRGRGEGQALYGALIQDALGRGLTVFSDVAVEADAVRVYESLARQGYGVVRLDGGGTLEDGAAYGKGSNTPAFQVTSAPGKVLHQTATGAKGVYNQKRKAKRDDYTLDLFGVPDNAGADSPAGKPAAGRQKRELSRNDAPGTYASRTELVQENTRDLGADKVTTPAEAAQALAYLSRGAVERFDALITDENGNPLAIVGAFKGALAQAAVYPATLAGEAFRVNGAANIWFAHNHPSGNSTLSDADINLNNSLSDVFRGSGITAHGILAIAGKEGDGRSWSFAPTRESPLLYGEKGATGSPQKTTPVPVVERVYAEEGKLGPAISSPDAAKRAAKALANGEAGVVLLTTQNEPVAFVPISESDSTLRGNGRMDALYRALSMANAGSAIIVNNGTVSDGVVQNLAGLFNSLDTRVLDVIDVSGATVRSWAEGGKGFNDRQFSQGKQGNRGSFNPATLSITLLKNADLSTFLHEAGHFFLEVTADIAGRNDAPVEIRKDMDALLTWFAVADIQEWHNLEFEQKRSYHEQFARGFEAYLFEGTAPSIELQSVFQRFRAWMLNVYKELKNLNVELTPEVRAVFDRMLASTEQIQLVEQGRSMLPLFETAEQAGMSPDEFAAYQSLGLDATQDAIGALESRGLRDLQWLRNAKGREVKKLQKESKAARAQVEMGVRRDVMMQPVYRAWQFLTNKIGAEDQIGPQALPKSDPETVNPEIDSLFVAIAKLGGIKREQAETLWGFDKREHTPQPAFGKPLLRRTDGMGIDAMGEALAELGYLDKDEHGRFDTAELEAKFSEELGGNTQFSFQYDYSRQQAPDARGNVTNPEALGAGRLDRGALIAEYGNDDGQVWKHLDALKMIANDGLHPEVVAELFGFSSADELVRTLAAAPDPQSEIDAITDQRMLEQFGDLSSAEAIDRAADKAIHNDARARFVATEANALAKATGRPRVLAKAAKAFAAGLIARLKIRDIKPGQYAAAGARAAKAAQKASQAGDIANAATEKRNELINIYATKAAHDGLEEVRKMLAYFKRFDTVSKTLDVDYREQIEALLERFDLRASTSNKAVAKRKTLAAWMEAQRELGLEPDVPEDLLDEAMRKSVKDMTLEELRGLRDTVAQIEHLGRLKHKLLTAQDQREFALIVAEAGESIVTNGGTARDVPLEEPTGVMPILAGLVAGHRKFASLLRQMDGGQDAGPLWRILGRNMNEAGVHESVMIEQATVRLTEIYAPLLQMKGGVNGDKQYIPEIKGSLTRGGRLSVALNWGNAANRQRVMGGDNWTEAQVMAILGRLNRTEWEFVQNAWAHIDSYWPQIAAKARRVTGVVPEKVDALPFQVPLADGSTIDLTGGYYPIKYDANRDDKAEKHDAAALASDMMRGAFTRATTRRGHTKQRVEEVNRPVKKTLDVLTQHVTEVVHDLSWHEWLIDANRLINARPINSAIREYYGTAVLRTMKDALVGIATADVIPQTAMDQVLMYLRGNISRSTMGLSLTTAFLQPFGLTQSMMRIGAPHVLQGLKRWGGDALRFESSLTWINAKSDFMRLRGKTFNRELHEIRGRVSQGHSKPRQLYDASLFMLMQKMQLVADIPTWIGGYEKAIAAGQDEDTAIALADQGVLDSQGSGQTKDMAELQRKHPMMSMFYSYFNVTYNLAAEATAGTDFKNPLAVAGWMSDMMLLMIIPALGPAILMALLRGDGGDDDPEAWALKLLKWQASYLLGTTMGVREIGGAVAGFDYTGPPVGRVVGDIGKLGKQAAQGEADEGLALASIRLLGSATGIPTVQILRSWRGWQAWENGEAPAASVLLGPPPRD